MKNNFTGFIIIFMKHLLTIILCVSLLGCGNIQNYPYSFKRDEKCYVIVKSSVSLNEKFKELLKEALKYKKNGIEDPNLEFEENYDSSQEGPGGFTYSVGTFTYNSGDKYEGEWKDWLHHGKGTYTWLDGDRYAGGWKDGKFHGQGALTCLDERGDKFEYQGKFRKGKYHGQGTFTVLVGKSM